LRSELDVVTWPPACDRASIVAWRSDIHRIDIQGEETPFRTPNARAFAERFVQTVRPECLDHLLVVNEAHLERVLRSYARHYNGHRPHQGIAQEIPAPEETAPLAVVPTIDSRHRHHRHRPPRIRRRDRLGELIYEYELAA